MILTITEHLSDVAHDVDAAHGDLVVSLSADDGLRAHLGYAPVRVADPVARFSGVAVVVGAEALAGVPDPVRLLVATGRAATPSGACPVRRSALPVLVRVDPVAGTASVLRRIRPPGEAEAPLVEPVLPAPAGTSEVE